jgi:transcriptional regulator with XRE-family HTH domain
MARECKGLTVAESCNRLGVDPDAWQRWESGYEAPPVDVGCQAAKLLGVETEWLADGEGAMLRA